MPFDTWAIMKKLIMFALTNITKAVSSTAS